MRKWTVILGLCVTVTMHGFASLPQSLKEPVACLLSVGSEGKGNDKAQQAFKLVSAAHVTAIPDLLACMDGANDYAMNWLRSAVESIAQREASLGKKLPIRQLESFVKQTQHHPKARRFAYELILKFSPEQAKGMIESFLNDPSTELRRDAVQLLLQQADRSALNNRESAISTYRQALASARDPDQIESIAKLLGDFGYKVDLPSVFGWVRRWKVIGPFDNTRNAGFSTRFAPEDSVDWAGVYSGKNGSVRWVDLEARGDYGKVDFNVPFGSLKEVVGYAAAEFWSEKERPAEIRLGCKNGWKVWVNGQFLFGRDEYHTGAEIDQFSLPVTLSAGRNIILVKCTQNHQTEDWTKEWEFQLRVTDKQGAPVLSAR